MCYNAAVVARIQSWIERLATRGMLPTESEEERLRRTILVAFALITLPPATFWFLLYASFGQWTAATIPIGYQALGLLNLTAFLRTGRVALFRFATFLLVLLLPFLLQWSLGGFRAASGAMIFGLAAPLGAIIMHGPHESYPWFAAYLVLTVGSILADGYLEQHAVLLPPAILALLFILNLIMVTVIAYFTLFYFAHQREEALIMLREERNALKAEKELTRQLKNEIAELHIEINQERHTREVAAITDTDYFRDLQQKAAQLRSRPVDPPPGEQVERADGS